MGGESRYTLGTKTLTNRPSELLALGPCIVAGDKAAGSTPQLSLESIKMILMPVH